MSDLSNLQRRLQTAFHENLSVALYQDLLDEVGELESRAGLMKELVQETRILTVSFSICRMLMNSQAARDDADKLIERANIVIKKAEAL